MKLFYGWVIVGAGIVITCLGMGTMMSLGVFLQPLSQEMGWTRAGVSVAADMGCRKMPSAIIVPIPRQVMTMPAPTMTQP